MKITAKIHYCVETIFWRKKIGNKLDYILSGGDLKESLQHTTKVFTDESPIIAREKAFSHFQSIVEVLYNGLNKEYKTDSQARIDLQKYLDSDNAVELLGSNQTKKFKITDDILNGIEIYMVINSPLNKSKDKQDQKISIHGIRYIGYPERIDGGIIESLKGLIKECKFYEENSYPFKDNFIFLPLHKIGGGVESVLKTPFDWELFMNKHEGKELI